MPQFHTDNSNIVRVTTEQDGRDVNIRLVVEDTEVLVAYFSGEDGLLHLSELEDHVVEALTTAGVEIADRRIVVAARRSTF